MAAPAIDDRLARGRAGEDAALQVYRRRGYRLVARNWRCSIGELDLVLERDGLLVFAEVKARSGLAFGGGYEAVTWIKRRKLRQLAEAFLTSRPSPPAQIRFDVASVWLDGARPDVEVFEDAF
jgi:putative endonuclease